MPIERDQDERVTYWCPKWYWPFAICTKTERKHKWCYSFAWVKRTAYGVVIHHEGCENGKLFTWDEFGIGVGTLGTEIPVGEMCFDSARTSAGICDPSNTGLMASGLSPKQPFVSDLSSDVRELKSSQVEAGSFEFTSETGTLCQQGTWPWKRVLHEQVITLMVARRMADIQWYVQGTALPASAGVVAVSAACRWPFPLPKGRVENRVVNVRYEVVTEEDRSTLRVFNDPADGSYVLGFTMSAMVDGKEHASSFTSWKFTGETCEFEPAQLAERDRCLRNLRDLGREKAKSRRPRPGEPVFLVSEEVLRFTPEANREAVRAILEIMATSFAYDPETIVRATNQIERETGLADVSRYVGVGAATQVQKLLVPR